MATLISTINRCEDLDLLRKAQVALRQRIVDVQAEQHRQRVEHGAATVRRARVGAFLIAGTDWEGACPSAQEGQRRAPQRAVRVAAGTVMEIAHKQPKKEWLWVKLDGRVTAFNRIQLGAMQAAVQPDRIRAEVQAVQFMKETRA